MDRGRKPNQESRSAELRGKLIAWKQIPESARPSLRALALELNASHQLLAHYLDDLEEWWAKENYRESKEKIQEIRGRADSEKRPVTAWEQQQIQSYDRTAGHYLLDSIVLGALTKWERGLEEDVKAGRPPAPQAGKLLRAFATRGNQRAQAILERYFPSSAKNKKNNLPLIPNRSIAGR